MKLFVLCSAKPLAQLCRFVGTALPTAWQNSAKREAQLCQTVGKNGIL